MKNLTLLIFIALAGTNMLHAQQAINSNYIPFHTFLKNNNTSKRLGITADNEIAFRHDIWTSDAWVFNDSSQYEYNSQSLETNGTSCTYSPAADSWIYDTLNSYTYDQSGNQLTHLSQSWSTTSNSWVNANNYIVTYNAAGSPLTQTYRVWAGDGGWQNTYNFVYSYDANNNLLVSVEQSWSTLTTKWVNTQQSIQTFNSNNQVTSTMAQQWNASPSNWTNFYLLLYSYDKQGNQTDRIEQTWRGSNWVNFYRDSSVFDANNNAIKIISQSWDTTNSRWVNTYQSVYAFDSNHNRIQFGTYNWNTINTTWVPVFFNNYTYNGAGKILTEVDSVWNATSSGYVNGYKAEYTYDGNNNTTGFQDYSGNNGSWVPSTVIMYNIDTNNKTVYELDQAYNGASGEIVNTDQYHYYYTIDAPVTSIQSVQNDLGALLYPNPTSGNNININLTLGENTDITLNTYDAQGRLLNSELRSVYGGANDLQISYPQLSSGIYYIQLISRSDEKISVLKFVRN